MESEISAPTVETDGEYELQQMSEALSVEVSITATGEPTISERSDHGSFSEFQEPPEPSLETLERAYRIARTWPKTSLEVLENASHALQSCREPEVRFGNHDDGLPERSSLLSLRDPYTTSLPPSLDHLSSAHPSLISLPPSSARSSDIRQREQSSSIAHQLSKSYRERNLSLSVYLPHLRNVCSSSRHDRANIRIFDYASSVLQSSKHRSFQFTSGTSTEPQMSTRSEIKDCRQFICSKNSYSQIDTRLVVVEELGPSLINLIGGTFDLSPEFFEEHLYRSAYSESNGQSVSPSTWRTSNLQKNFVSFAWSRPVESWPLPLWIDQQKDKTDKKDAYITISHDSAPNIQRPEIEMSTEPEGQLPDHAPSGWEERATVCNVEIDGLQYVILLLDPIPLLKKTTTGRASAMKPSVTHEGHFGLSNCKSRNEPVSVRANVLRQTEYLSRFTQKFCRTPWILDYYSLFRQSRTFATAQEIVDGFLPFQSTAEAFEKWLVSAPADEVEKYDNRLGPGSMIFRLAHQDTVDLLRLMRLAIAEIEIASSDSVLQEKALHWRYRLDQFRALLVELEASLHSFIAFLNTDITIPSTGPVHKLDKDPIEFLLSDVVREIGIHKQRITQAYSSLTSKVQISDSHRSIAEAETVTRLTELAFLFIPLSFATSIFGMQFINGSTAASTYIAVAVALTSAAYLLRFIIHRTTEHRSSIRRSIRRQITEYASLRPGSRIPTATFVQWLGHVLIESTERMLGLIILITIVIPFPIIWTSSLNTSLQIALSCLLISAPILFVASLLWARLLRL